MLKINSYRLFFLALFFNHSSTLGSSFTQPDSDQYLSTNTSNTQQGATHYTATEFFMREEAEFTNALANLVRMWECNAALFSLLETNNNTTLPPPLPNVADTSSNISSVVAPISHSGNTNSAMTASSNPHTYNNNIPLFIPDELSPSNTTSSILPHTNPDNDHGMTQKKKKHPPKNYTCPTCHKNLVGLFAFNYHLKTHDPNRIKPFKCNICGKSFTAKHTLKIHIKRHNKEKSFKCDYCPKCFTTKFEKNQHHRTHTGEKPYKCHICQRRLKSKGGLDEHLNKHLGKKPYKCNIGNCNKAYASNNGLKSHKKTHNRHKPYTCHYCSADFTCKRKYESHIRYQERDEDCKCHICKKRV